MLLFTKLIEIAAKDETLNSMDHFKMTSWPSSNADPFSNGPTHKQLLPFFDHTADIGPVQTLYTLHVYSKIFQK